MKLPSDFDIFSPSTFSIAVVHPVARELVAGADGLRDLVLVVREHEVAAAAVDVEAVAEDLQRHRRALDVPARAGPGPTATPTAARPAWPPSTARSRPGCACARRRRRARPRSRAAPRACGATARRTRAASRPGSTRPGPRRRTRGRSRRARAISACICVDPLGRARHLVGPQDVQAVELRSRTRPRTSPTSSGSVVPLALRPGDDLVLDVGDVADVRDVADRATAR